MFILKYVSILEIWKGNISKISHTNYVISFITSFTLLNHSLTGKIYNLSTYIFKKINPFSRISIHNQIFDVNIEIRAVQLFPIPGTIDTILVINKQFSVQYKPVITSEPHRIWKISELTKNELNYAEQTQILYICIMLYIESKI